MYLRLHRVMLQARMREANRNSNVRNLVIDVQMVQRRSIMYYQQLESQPFLKIIVALPTMVASCRGKFRYYSRHSMSSILLISVKLIGI
jgi:DNA polymerase delta subunit 1